MNLHNDVTHIADIKAIIEDKETIKKIEFVLGMAKHSYQVQRANPCNIGGVEQVLIEQQSKIIKEVEEILSILKDYQGQK